MTEVPMITLRYPNYISAFPLAEVMPVLLKEDLLWMAGQFGMTVSKNQKKEVIAQMVSEYLLTHPKEVLSLIPSNELKMLCELVKLESSSKWDDMFVDNQPYAEDDGLWKHYKEDMKRRKA